MGADQAQGEDCDCTVSFLTGGGVMEAVENCVLPCGVYTEDADCSDELNSFESGPSDFHASQCSLTRVTDDK